MTISTDHSDRTDPSGRTEAARHLVTSWEAQQAVYIPQRESRFALMLDLIEELALPDGRPLRVLDVACGPGSASARVLARFPDALVVSVDKDPLLLELGRLSQAGRNREPVWLEADLCEPGWPSRLPHSEFDAVVSTTALHWLPATDLAAVYATLRGLLRPDGVLLNGDYLPGGRPRGRLDDAVKAIGERRGQALVSAGALEWDSWWDQARSVPGFATEVAAHDAAFRDRLTHEAPSLDFHREALREAGFRETALVWHDLTEGLLCALA